MYPALLHSHSGLRWILLILLILTIAKAYGAFSSNKAFSEQDRKVSLFALISAHLQAVLGLGLYFMSTKVDFSSTTMSSPVHRFFTMEHTLMMLIALVLITLGYRHAKAGNAKKVFWFYLISLVIILAAIPWPFRTALSGGWF
jgi:hypothetical protein